MFETFTDSLREVQENMRVELEDEKQLHHLKLLLSDLGPEGINEVLQYSKEKGHSIKEVSDGYHTFGELYEHRHRLFIMMCAVLSKDEQGSPIWRSKEHSDGTMFDDMFVMGVNKRKGIQITYHLPMDKWELTSFAETLNKAPEFDGHSSEDVLERLLNCISF